MPNLWSTAFLLLGLCAAAAVGYFVKTRLPERHRSGESLEVVQRNISLLVTFTAIMLGLLTNSVKNGFDNAFNAFSSFSGQLIQMDQCLRDYGPETTPIREQLRVYVASVIATTWPREERPEGITYPNLNGVAGVGESRVLGAIVNEVGPELRSLRPGDAIHQGLQALCEQEYSELVKGRWDVIGLGRPSFTSPFYWVMVLWLVILFASIGLTAPGTPVSIIVISLSAVSTIVAVYVILDLDLPFDGLFSIPSEPMRHAFADMML